ncbi:MAG TPA: DEAD/DEAH box helicase family protein [Blastocatellia bacterium]|nr:DEAD/DEAH box helicase family protein [Blastocatellia bacterium]
MGYIPEAIRRQVLFFDAKQCQTCGRPIDGKVLMRHLDHLLPAASGGEAVVFNLRQLCHECNLAKSTHLVEPAQRLLVLQQRRLAELTDYFQNAPARIVGNERLRDPQAEAYLAIRDYFSQQPSAPAIVEIPTGCGKTGIICIAPFGVARGRVLIIVPNLTIKSMVEKALSTTNNFYLKCGVFTDINHLPTFVVLERGQANCEDCLRADMIIANVQQMQGWLPLFDSDFFDMVIVDEAHHVPAESWRKVNDAFPDAMKLYLTATPFRSDNKPIVAERIYEYRLAQAISKGYVKNVMKVDAVASRMTFTIEGESREFSYEEIMEMREETWFSRGVALSELCNETIIDQSIGILLEKRKSGLPHQIVAAACSISHAIQIVTLYESRGIRSVYVASEGMSLQERERRLADFEGGRYDCIVQVGILGEGYDNPNVSIAAIFRPYRSLSPYVQFVGRTLRHMEGGTADDNLAHVVSHVGLNLDRLWEYFKNEIREAAILNYIDEEDRQTDSRSLAKKRRQGQAVEVTNQVIERFVVDTFVPVAGINTAYIEEAVGQIDIILGKLREQGVQVPDQMIREQIVELNRPVGARPYASAVKRPDLERKQYRLWLNKEIIRAAGSIMAELRIPTDASLVARLGDGDERNNYEVIISSLHRAINEAMGKDRSNSRRNSWTLDELKLARQSVTRVRQGVLCALKDRLMDESDKPHQGS